MWGEQDRMAAKTITWLRTASTLEHFNAALWSSRCCTVCFLSLSPPFLPLSFLPSPASPLWFSRRGARLRETLCQSLVTVLHGDVNQSVRVSVSWAKPYRVCQCECLSVCVLVSVSLIQRAEWMESERVFPIRRARTHAPFVCLEKDIHISIKVFHVQS